MGDEPRGALTGRSLTLIVFVDSGLFHGLLLTVWEVLEQFPWLMNRKVWLRVDHQQSPIWPILARFMSYYSQLWGPGAIFTIDAPRGAFTCRSSKLKVWANSGPFHRQLLTVWGSRSDFQD